jgi:signal transduction histidine kinase
VASLADITRQQELQQTKNDVISLVSHEMRTPLTAIQGMSELLAHYEVSPERRREMNLAINDEVKRLTRMITQYLDITRLESGATVLRRTPVRVEVLIERTTLLLGQLAAERDIRITRQFPPDLPGIVADPDLLGRAIDNLVSNAIKYSRPGTGVSVAVEARDAEIAILVIDEGFGIPPEDTQRIFEKFYRVPRAQDADIPGTGLGLPLVKEIAELHGGSISVHSEVGVGSTFVLRLPAAGAPTMSGIC